MFNALHYSMLVDKERNNAFYEGLRASIQPGDIVIDGGSGTGLLSMMAAELGASKVYALEREKETAMISREIIRENGFEDIIKIVNSEIMDFIPEEKVDLVISETIGNFLLNERIIPIRDHLSKFLKDKTRFIPGNMELILRPCYSEEFEKKHQNIKNINGFSYLSMNEFIKNSMFSLRLSEKVFSGNETLSMKFDLCTEEEFPKTENKKIKFESMKKINGLGAYFNIGIVDGVVLSNSPCHPLSHWPQFFMPLGRSVETDNIEIELKISTPDYEGFNWIVETDDEVFSASTALSCLN